MAKITKINHIAFVVADIENSLSFWRDAMGLDLDHIDDVESQKSRIAVLPLCDNNLELVQPTSTETGVAKFLDDRGPGMHHICFEVDNIDEFLVDLKGRGVRLINENPLQLDDRKIAFIHPKSANGVLVELYQLI